MVTLQTTTICQSQIAAEELKIRDDAWLDSNWSLPKYFGHIKVITMDQNGERYKLFQEEIRKIGLSESEFEVVQGIDGKTLPLSLWNRMESSDIRKGECPPEHLERRKQGQMGCYMAHYQAIKATAAMYEKAKAAFETLQSRPDTSPEALAAASEALKKYSSVLIMEDNNGFGKVTGPRSAELSTYGKKFREVMKDLPETWDMFYFKSMKLPQNAIEQITPRLAKMSYGVVTKCYAIHAPMYVKVVKVLEEALAGDQKIHPVDNVIATLHPSTRCYVATPPLTYRMASESLVFGGKKGAKPEDFKHWQSDAAGK